MVNKISENLINSDSKDPCKAVSGEMGIPQEFVRKVYQIKRVGAARASKKIESNLVIITADTETNIVAKPVICEDAKDRKRSRNQISDDSKLQVIELFEEMVPATKIKEEIGISLQTVYNILKSFYGEQQYEEKKAELAEKRKLQKGDKTEMARRNKPKNGGQKRKSSISKIVTSKASNNSFKDLQKEINSKQEKIEDRIAYKKAMIETIKNEEKDFNKIEEPEIVKPNINNINTDTPISKCVKDSYTIFDIGRFQLEQINTSNGVECVLIGGRHDSPIDKCIFKHSLSNDMIFDYSTQEDIINNFINEECKDKKSLIVYISGLQTTLASLIKVCFEKNISLTLMHYNGSESSAKKNVYTPQKIWDFEIESSIKVRQFERMCNICPVFLYGNIKAKDIIAGKELACICLNKKYSDKMKMISMIITETPNWEIFSHCVENTISNKNLKLGVSMNKIMIGKDGFEWGDKYAQTYSPLATK